MNKWILISIVYLVASIVSFVSCRKEAVLPTLTTNEVSNIKTQSALFGGTILDNGGAEIELRGVCWATSDNPTIDCYKKYCREGNGSFECSVNSLIPNTYYHVRAFTYNRVGVAYGNEVHFRTKQIIAPKVTTTADILSTTFTSATIAGNITCYDETPILERGICWSTTAYPTVNNYMIRCGAGSGIFTCSIAQLQPKTCYYTRAYAVTISGITYGNEIQFKTQALPDITTNPVTEFSSTTARVSGKLLLYYDPQLAWSVVTCFGTTSGPTINGYNVEIDSLGNDGVFTCTLTNLIPGTLYYVRVCWYASDWGDDNLQFILYGNEVTFTTSQ